MEVDENNNGLKESLLLTSLCETISCLTSPNETIMYVVNSRSFGNYLTVRCKIFKKWIAKYSINVRLPNNEIIQNTHKSYFPDSGQQ